MMAAPCDLFYALFQAGHLEMTFTATADYKMSHVFEHMHPPQ